MNVLQSSLEIRFRIQWQTKASPEAKMKSENAFFYKRLGSTSKFSQLLYSDIALSITDFFHHLLSRRNSINEMKIANFVINTQSYY